MFGNNVIFEKPKTNLVFYRPVKPNTLNFDPDTE